MGIDTVLQTARKSAVILGVLTALVAGWLAMHYMAYHFFKDLPSFVPQIMVTPIRIVSYLLPSNFWTCVYFISAVYAGRWLWDTQREYLKMAASAT